MESKIKRTLTGEYVEMTAEEIARLENTSTQDTEPTADEILISLPDDIKSRLVELVQQSMSKANSEKEQEVSDL